MDRQLFAASTLSPRERKRRAGAGPLPAAVSRSGGGTAAMPVAVRGRNSPPAPMCAGRGVGTGSGGAGNRAPRPPPPDGSLPSGWRGQNKPRGGGFYLGTPGDQPNQPPPFLLRKLMLRSNQRPLNLRNIRRELIRHSQVLNRFREVLIPQMQ